MTSLSCCAKFLVPAKATVHGCIERPDKILLRRRECWKRTNGFGVDIDHYLTDLIAVLPHAHSADD
jgi:hypothetical protein